MKQHLEYALSNLPDKEVWEYDEAMLSAQRIVQPQQLAAKLLEIKSASPESRRKERKLDEFPCPSDDSQENEIEIESMLRTANNIYWPKLLKVTIDQLKEYAEYRDFEDAYNNHGLCPVSVMQNYCHKGVFGKNQRLNYGDAIIVVEDLMALYKIEDWKGRYTL